ncbi:MAG: hypothetical protein R3C56_42995 [Pirellulaceae bacterium]
MHVVQLRFLSTKQKCWRQAPVVHQSLDHELCIQLERIEIRFRELVQQRNGHLWDDGEPPYPPVLRLYQCGVRKGHFAFPMGTIVGEW